jgi:phenylalanyl-tRNA synthetase beta chain
VERDISMVVDKHVPFKIIEETAWKIRQDRLKQVSLFDLFESEKLGENKRSLALSFTFQDEEKTMTDDEVDRIMNQLMKAFETDLQAEIRKG